MSIKEGVLDIAKNLPEKCTWEDVLYQIYARRQLSDGLKDEAGGRLVQHAKVFARYAKKKGKH